MDTYETKSCGLCKESLPLDSFSFKNKEKGTRSSYCKECNKKKNREHYQKNKDSYAEKRIRYRKENGYTPSKQRVFIYHWFLTHPCIDCGESDPATLSFDHRDRGQKSFNISADAGKYSVERIQSEIEKCDVVCLNCHARRTAKQFNWYASMPPSYIG